MPPTPQPPVANPRAAGVLAALLDFEQAPGRYPVARREPALLFDQLGTVLRLASNRAVEGGTASAPRARRAARFFVRTVMLRPGADHYAVLGLTPAATPELLREHYRMMIRLVHPDFVREEEAWPADAAARINIAHDVLSSPERRQRYDATLAPARAQPKPAPVAAPRPRGHRAPPMRLPARRVVQAGVATALLLAGLGWWVGGPRRPGVSLMAQAPRPDALVPPAGPATAPPALRLEDVRPTLDQVVGALRSGRGETVLQVLNQEWRSHPETTRFVGDFNQRLAGRTVRGLDEVKNQLSRAADGFVVDSALDFRLQNAQQQDETLRLNLQSVFQVQQGSPVLTRLVAQP
ncbi:J domain-containing protein [Hydrogenophaga flava]|uniref:J domain-containing protein n=1 Tax=Hydrogenophaga flava TaxID=65657 RepID=UPI000824FE5D|nr:J domain-containing protein [Hydrogenophaga flava]